MPIGAFINAVPMPVFMVIHTVAFLIGATFAVKAKGAGEGGLAAAFGLFAVAELLYLSYHLDWTVILFAHTLAEVCDLLAFVLVFATASSKLFARATAAR
ncbi:MAG: hypothetical protein A2085_10100 [Gemmatimonadetes bacterium GWC2_71_10]|nr:MAG: hypothetical protein A2085_10100 [Gemmatimonadetes bacterium GWC2_71_10]